MKITYIERNVNLRDNFKFRVEKKLNKFSNIFSDDALVYVTVTVQKNDQTVEITIKDKGIIYRAEHTCLEMNDAVDKVVDVIGGLIRKNKTKLEKKHKGSAALDSFIADYDFADETFEEEDFEIARTKNIPIKPMSVEEAILQMNLLNHQFFMFKDADTNEIAVVYKRKAGKYGLLIPDEDAD